MVTDSIQVEGRLVVDYKDFLVSIQDVGHLRVLSKRLKGYLPHASLKQNFVRYEGKKIQLPNKLAESSEDIFED